MEDTNLEHKGEQEFPGQTVTESLNSKAGASSLVDKLGHKPQVWDLLSEALTVGGAVGRLLLPGNESDGSVLTNRSEGLHEPLQDAAPELVPRYGGGLAAHRLGRGIGRGELGAQEAQSLGSLGPSAPFKCPPEGLKLR